MWTVLWCLRTFPGLTGVVTGLQGNFLESPGLGVPVKVTVFFFFFLVVPFLLITRDPSYLWVHILTFDSTVSPIFSPERNFSHPIVPEDILLDTLIFPRSVCLTFLSFVFLVG